MVPLSNNHCLINASVAEVPIINETTHSVTNASNRVVPDDQIDYKAKILLFIEMQKLKLISEAVAEGISEATVHEAIQEENLIDFSLEHLKAIIKQRAKNL